MRLIENLQNAIKSEDTEQLSKLLAESDASDIAHALSDKSDNQWTLLMKAASGGNVDIVGQFLAAKAPVNDDVAGVTPLMAACMQAPVYTAAEVVSTLLEAKADPNAVDTFRETCLMKAAARGLAEVIHVLLKADADVNARDNDNHAAIYHAARVGHAAAVRCLLQAGTDEQAKSDALDIAEAKELTEIIAILSPESIKPEVELPVVLPERYTFAKKVLAELPKGNGRVGFPSDISLLLSGVGQSHYANALVAKGFGVAQVICANNQELQDAGVRFAPQRHAIMDGMVRMAEHGWSAPLPKVNTFLGAVHAACNAVRQIHIMWSTTVLGRDRLDPEFESVPDPYGYLATTAIRVNRKLIKNAMEIRRRAAIAAKLAERKMWTDPVAPADLIRPGA